MSFPSFEDFLGSLTEENRNYIISDMPTLNVNLFTSEGLTQYTTVVMAHSYVMSTRLLKLYHEWLAEQLSNQE